MRLAHHSWWGTVFTPTRMMADHRGIYKIQVLILKAHFTPYLPTAFQLSVKTRHDFTVLDDGGLVVFSKFNSSIVSAICLCRIIATVPCHSHPLHTTVQKGFEVLECHLHFALYEEVHLFVDCSILSSQFLPNLIHRNIRMCLIEYGQNHS